MRKRIKSYHFLTLTLFIFPALASTKTITIENYTQSPLRYFEVMKNDKSLVEMPSSVSAGSGSDFSKSKGLIILSDKEPSQGLFRIGYDFKHYCTYSYTNDPTAGNPWFMYAISTNNTDNVSCSVDVDVHSFIVFQKMG